MSLEFLSPASDDASASTPTLSWAKAPRAAAGERICPDAGLLALLLDEIDYGVALVAPSGRLRFANQRAQGEFGEGRPLRVYGDSLMARRAIDQSTLQSALASAQKGRRSLVVLGEGGQQISVAFVPIEARSVGSDLPAIALVFQKRQRCEALTLNFFARTHHLTLAETTVLEALCNGARPAEIAHQLGVAVSTVRTQISSIRAKTQTGSMRELVQTLSTLPPLTSAVKSLAH